MALPTHVDRITRFAGTDAPGGSSRSCSPRDDGTGVDAGWLTNAATSRVLLEGYRTIELPGVLDPEALEPIRSAMR